MGEIIKIFRIDGLKDLFGEIFMQHCHQRCSSFVRF